MIQGSNFAKMVSKKIWRKPRISRKVQKFRQRDLQFFFAYLFTVSFFCGRGGEGFGFPLPICNRYLKSWLICIFQLWMSPWFENLKNLLSKAFLDFILTFLRLLIYQNAHFFNDSDEFQILRICWSNISMQEVMRLPRLDF